MYEAVSFAPLGLLPPWSKPTAGAVGCTLAPLRGFHIRRGFHNRRGAAGRTSEHRHTARPTWKSGPSGPRYEGTKIGFSTDGHLSGLGPALSLLCHHQLAVLDFNTANIVRQLQAIALFGKLFLQRGID